MVERTMNDTADKPKSKSKEKSPPNDSKSNVSLPINWGRLVSFIVLLVVIGVIGLFTLRVMQSFLLPLFLAALCVVIFRPVHTWLLEKCKGRQRIAALLTTAVVSLTVLGPLGWAANAAIKEGAVLTTRDWDPRDLSRRLEKLRARFGLQMPYREELDQLQSLIAQVTWTTDETGGQQREFSARDLSVLDQIDLKLVTLEARLALPDQSEEGTSKSKDDLLDMQNSIVQAREAGAAILRDGQTLATSQAFDNVMTRLGVQLESMRDDLVGGFPRSSLVRLANPTATELELWQTKVRDYFKSFLLSLGGRSTALLASVVFGLLIMLISIYYFLIDGPEMIKTAMRLSPLDDRYEEELLVEFGQVSRAVVLATLLSAVAQGLLAGIGYFFAGFEPVFLLTVLTMMLALVPFVGAAAVWVPAALYLAFIDDRMTAGIVLAIYGACIVSMADNVIKPLVLHGESNMHPLLALLSVLGGVQALGPIGILVGPMLLAFLQALLNMLQHEIKTMSTG
jgi:predicted PurR-regulated permease PerM